MLSIQNLSVEITGKKILNQFSLEVGPGEMHVIMGQNGAGKSTLGHVLAGQEGFDISQGSIDFMGQDLLSLSVEERALAGLFLAFQYPIEIPGVNNAYFLRAALNAKRKYLQQEPVDAVDFLSLVKQKMRALGMDENFLQRPLNSGFSGGEKKRNEILQMMLLEPKLCILDEPDSGLDIDALQAIAKGIQTLKNTERSFIVITHYQRLLNYLEPDYVHVMSEGRIVRSGGPELAKELEAVGYQQVISHAKT